MAGPAPREGRDHAPLPQVPAEPVSPGARPAGRGGTAGRSEERRPAIRPRSSWRNPSLNEQRIGAVMAAIRASGAKRVLDLGCGEGRLLRELLKDEQFEEIVGMDVSIRSLENARDRLKLDRLADKQAESS